MSKIEQIKVGDTLPQREFKPDSVQLFLYNTVLFNAHRIHFDYPYTTEVENYPDLVVPGPLLGDWLNQCINEWLGEEGHLASIDYSNRKAAYVGEPLHSGGKIISYNEEKREAQIEVYIKNTAGEVIAPGLAVVRL
jgi:3-methylfumaryl-CoA hydratase